MLDELFLEVIDMTKTGSIVILAVMLARLLLKKAPKIYSYALWAVVLIRLLCPVAIETDFSLLPDMEPVAESYSLSDAPVSFLGASEAAYRAVGDALNGGLGIQHIPTTQPAAAEDPAPITVTSYWWEVWILFGQYVWAAGIGVMTLYSIIKYRKLRRALVGAARLEDNIFLADHIDSPFVMGLFRPKIYLPSSLPQREREYIILHERHHIRRFDHVVKAASFAALCLHWFNPLVWAAFILSGQDMEMSCDEAVVKKLGDGIRADYASSLLSLATGRRIIAGTPLAFGEGDTGSRIRNLAKRKKPALWLSIVALILVLCVGVALLLDPAAKQTTLMGANYTIKETVYSQEETDPPLQYGVTADFHLYQQQESSEEWNYLGKLEHCAMTDSELSSWLPEDLPRRDFPRNVTDAYILTLEGGYFYLVFQTERGKTYLAYGWEDSAPRHEGAPRDAVLRTLYEIESALRANAFHTGFFDRSLTHSVGKEVETFSYWSSQYYPGYAVVGYKAGQERQDLGFAVFRSYDGVGYKLIQLELYEEAALMENGICFCNDPAVLDENGPGTDANSFDVILSVNRELNSISRIYHYEDDREVKETAHAGGVSMTLFPWADSVGAERIEQYYIDFDDNVIEDFGISPVRSGLDLTPGTAYVSEQCLVMNPLSSFYPFGGDSGARYVIGTDTFTIEYRNGASMVLEDISWQWQSMPYSAEDFESWAPLGNSAGLGSLAEDARYIPLSDDTFLMERNGVLMLVEMPEINKLGRQIWSIYTLVPEESKGSATWLSAPALSSTSPVFSFVFDMDCTRIQATCVDGALVDIGGTRESASTMDFTDGSTLYWSPWNEEDGFVSSARITFTVYQGEQAAYSGRLYITSEPADGPGNAYYTARLVGTDLNLTQGAAMYSIIQPENQIYSEISFQNLESAHLVNRIRLTNCHNGKTTELTDVRQIQEILDFIRGVSGKDVESGKGYYEGSYSLEFLYSDTSLFRISFGDMDVFYYGTYIDNYPCRYHLDGMTIQDVTDFFSKYDASAAN